ncbi:MAG: diaminopropionate ammonia-lyase [Pseudomonadales bacterium]|nr:diaminopropionate ammonia-lyase [Pseudomonadales bacterium]
MTRIHFSEPDTRSLLTHPDVFASLGLHAARRVRQVLGACPAYAPTKVHPLSTIAHEWGLGQVWAKDERSRLDLRSFKALGGTYAVISLGEAIAMRHGGATHSIVDLIRFGHPAVRATTFAAATSGNHGRAVAAGARLVGARCVVFVKSGVPKAQLTAIRDLGARVVEVTGTYDDAVAACEVACRQHGWIGVPDCAMQEDDSTVTLVMEGYSLIGAELLEQLPRPPTHLVLQAGVGGLAASVGGHVFAQTGNGARVVVSEPDVAACLQASAMAGRPVRLQPTSSTTMGRLDCYTPSLSAWRILEKIVSAWATVSDEDAEWACARLAQYDLRTTPSGAAGLAAFKVLMTSPGARERLGLDKESEVAIVVTEAALES